MGPLLEGPPGQVTGRAPMELPPAATFLSLPQKAKKSWGSGLAAFRALFRGASASRLSFRSLHMEVTV